MVVFHKFSTGFPQVDLKVVEKYNRVKEIKMAKKKSEEVKEVKEGKEVKKGNCSPGPYVFSGS